MPNINGIQVDCNRNRNYDSVTLDVERLQTHSHTRITLTNLDQGTVPFLRQFGDFYKCNLSRSEFNTRATHEKEATLQFIVNNIAGKINNVDLAYLNFRINLCNTGLEEAWHSPVFAVICNNEIILTTGSNKIYATAIRKQKYNMDFDVLLLVPDNSPPNDKKLLNVVQLHTDDDVVALIGTDDFVFEMSFDRYKELRTPAIIDFSRHYPIPTVSLTETALAVAQRGFFTNNIKNNKLDIEIHDNYSSLISDTSNLFNVIAPDTVVVLEKHNGARKLKKSNNSNALRFITLKKIQFDLADLLLFFTEGITIYSAIDQSYVVVTNIEEPHHVEKNSCPSVLL
jgi:hypothetical protein